MRHHKVKGTASPFDGDWRYWAARRGHYPGIAPRVAILLRNQHGRCGHCALVFLPEAFLEVHPRNQQRGDNSYRNLVAVHRHCHDQIHGAVVIVRSGMICMTKADPLEEPCARKPACTVLQTSGGSDPFAEFNRPLRRAVLGRRRSFGTQSEAGSQFVERILTTVTTLRQQRRDVLDYLTAACTAAIRKESAPFLLLLTPSALSAM